MTGRLLRSNTDYTDLNVSDMADSIGNTPVTKDATTVSIPAPPACTGIRRPPSDQKRVIRAPHRLRNGKTTNHKKLYYPIPPYRGNEILKLYGFVYTMTMILSIIVVVKLWSFLSQFSSYLDEICSEGVLWSDQLSTSSNTSCNVMSGFYDVLNGHDLISS